ncbi:uncharacterized protein [Penaeus vannamei]|uniref:uncharacterized protein n=1 Tax=Penaeus vannamei TaxID=6689 RepID=UPI00387F7CD5
MMQHPALILLLSSCLTLAFSLSVIPRPCDRLCLRRSPLGPSEYVCCQKKCPGKSEEYCSDNPPPVTYCQGPGPCPLGQMCCWDPCLSRGVCKTPFYYIDGIDVPV